MTGSSWTCPFCNRPTTITEEDADYNNVGLFHDTKHGYVGISWVSIRCPNKDCHEVFLKVFFDEREIKDRSYENEVVKHLQTWTLRPESNAKPQPEYIPSQIREDYHEACLIAEKSPKASAALSRRCLQGMIRNFWDIKRKRLIDEVNALEDLVDADTWEAIKAVKDVGTIGAHMEQNINIIIPVDQDEAILLIKMIEQLFEDWYVHRHRKQQRMQRTIEMAKNKKEQKNQNPEA